MFNYGISDGEPKVGKIVGHIILAIVLIAVIGVAGEYVSAAGSVASAPARVIQRTYTTDNMMNAYHEFRDEYNGYQARLAQIKAKLSTVNEKGISEDEKNRREIELEGQQQSCRDIVAEYNADSEKVDQSMFKDPMFISNHLPPTLDLNTCNTGDYAE